MFSVLTGSVRSQSIQVDLREIEKYYETQFRITEWDTLPRFDFSTLAFGPRYRIPHFLKSDFRPTTKLVEYGAVSGYRVKYDYPRIYSFEFREKEGGEFYEFEPRDLTIPGLEIEFEPLGDVAEAVRVASLQKAWRESVGRSLAAAAPTGQQRKGLINVDIPLPMPDQLESVFGPGDKTNISISGREAITFAGESRRVDPFIGVEGKQKQSLFPSLEMEQQLDVTVSGQVGDKVFVEVDHSSQATMDNANKIQLYYQGYDDDVIKRIDLGNTTLSLPGAGLVSFSSASTGLFGVKMLAEIGGTELTAIASKQEGETSSSSFTPKGGEIGTTEERKIRDIDYVRNKYFYFDNPYVVPIGVIRPDNSDAVTKPIEVWRSITPNEIQANPELDWRPGRAFVDYLGEGADIDAAIDDIKNNRKPAASVDLQFQRLVVEQDYDFIVDLDNQNQVIGLILTRPVPEDRALAVTYTTSTEKKIGGSYSELGIPAERDTVVLDLIKAPNPRPTGEFGYTWNYMMRFYYNLGISNIDAASLELEIRDLTQRLDTSVPTGSKIPYIQIFGLDQLDRAGNPVPDARVDIGPQALDPSTGILQFPSAWPFAPDTNSVAAWTNGQFSFSDSLYQAQYAKSLRLYTEYLTNPIVDVYQYDIVVRAVSTSKTFRIEALNVVENSEKVILDGKQLMRNRDYSINYDTGEVELKGDVLNELTPDSKINIDYEFTPFGGGASSSLVGFSTISKFGEDLRFGSTWLYESKGTSSEKPRLGEEPTRAIVGGFSGSLQHDSNLLTDLANLLPLVDTDAPSTLSLTGELAASFPDPNTKGEAYLEDFEGVEDSDRFTTSRRAWYWASPPYVAIDSTTSEPKPPAKRTGFIWYNVEPDWGAHRRDLNPQLNERENTLVPTIDIELDPGYDPADDSLWVGLMTGFGSGGLDLSRGQFLEIWVNDFKPNPAERGGTLRIDLGRIDEDFINPSENRWDDEDIERDGFAACFDDMGLDQQFNAIPDCVANTTLERETEEPGNTVTDFDKAGDDYLSSRIDGRFTKVNGTEKNGVLDSEDLDRSGQLDQLNSYLSLEIDLSDTAVVDIRESFPTYDGFNNLSHARDSWRLYRLNLAEAIPVSPGGVEPRLDEVRQVRVWIDNVGETFQDVQAPGRLRFQFAELKVVGNRWELDGVRDLDGNLISDTLLVATQFGIGVISTKTDPGLYNPPIVPRQDEAGVFEKEQSLFLEFDSLEAGTSVRIFRRIIGTGLDLTNYRELNFWVHADPALFNHDLEYLFSLAFDDKNFYEITLPLTDEYFDPISGWARVLIELEDLAMLKSEQASAGQDVFGSAQDMVDTDRLYPVRLRNQPNLFDVRYLYAGVRNVSETGQRFSGQIWIDDIYAGDVRRDRGLAGSVNANLGIGGNILNLSGGWQRTDADFRRLRERRGSGTVNQSFNINARTRLEHFVPLFGFSIPLSGNYVESTSLPKYLPSSDIVITDRVVQDSLRTEQTTRSFSTSLSKKGSRNPLLKYSIDKMTTNFAYSERISRSPTNRDTTQTMNGTLGYDITWSKARDVNILKKLKLRYWLNSLNFRVQANRATTSRSRLREGEFVPDPYYYDAGATYSGSASYSPIRTLSSSFAATMTRDMGLTHEWHGINIGQEVGRSHNLQVNWRPTFLYLSELSPNLNYNSGYNESQDPRVLRPNDPPGTRNASNQRTATARFDVKVGEYFGKLLGKVGWLPEDEKEGQKAKKPEPGARAPAGEGSGQPRAGEGRPEAGEPQPPGTGEPQPPGTGEPQPPGTGEPQPPGTGGTASPTVGKPQQPAAPDTTAAKRRADPMVALRKFGQILTDVQKFNINVQHRMNSSYTRIPDRPSLAYQFAFERSAGIEGATGALDEPDRSNSGLTISLDSGVQITKDIDVTGRYSTMFSYSSTQGSETEARSVTWPDFGVRWSGLERLGPFRRIWSASTARLTFKKDSNESGRKGLVDISRENLAISPALLFTFKNEINSTLTGSYNRSTSDQRGSKTETSSMSVTLDLKKDFRGGSGLKLPIPFFRKEIKWRSTLNTNLSITYSRTGGKKFLPGSTVYEPIPITTSLSVSPNLTYNFSSALNGRFFVDYARSYAQATDQTITSLTIGISAALTF